MSLTVVFIGNLTEALKYQIRRRNIPPPVYGENMRIALNKWRASNDGKRKYLGKYNRRVTATKSQVKPQVPKQRKSLPQAIMPSNAVRTNIHHTSLRESKYAGCNIF